jgi:hypothetical protein
MPTFTLTVFIDDKIIQMNPSDSLCLAQNVNGVYNAISQSAAVVPKVADGITLSGQTEFSWTTEYGVYLTKDYGDQVVIKTKTTSKTIALGQEISVSDSEGGITLKSAVASGDIAPAKAKSSFLIKNIPMSWHAAVTLKTGPKGTPSTIFVDPDTHMGKAKSLITPFNKYLLFWWDKIETEAVYVLTESEEKKLFEFDEGKSTKSIRFGYHDANTPKPNEQPTWWDVEA